MAAQVSCLESVVRLKQESRLNLPPGKYQLKWVIDGKWTVNRAMPVVSTHMPDLINCA